MFCRDIFLKFYSENYLDIQENPIVRILKVRKSFKEFKQRDVFFNSQSNACRQSITDNEAGLWTQDFPTTLFFPKIQVNL